MITAIGFVIVGYAYVIFLANRNDLGGGLSAAAILITPYLLIAYRVIKTHTKVVMIATWVLLLLNTIEFERVLHGASPIVGRGKAG